jgi:ribosomal protein S27E
MATTPSTSQPDAQGRLLRLRCPHCNVEYPLWFRPDPADDQTLTSSEWEMWLETKCGECGHTPGSAAAPRSH